MSWVVRGARGGMRCHQMQAAERAVLCRIRFPQASSCTDQRVSSITSAPSLSSSSRQAEADVKAREAKLAAALEEAQRLRK